MRTGKVFIGWVLLCVFACAFSSCKDGETKISSVQNTENTLDVSSQETASATASAPEMRPEDLVVENLRINEEGTNVTGQINDIMSIDAKLMSTVDPMAPGKASSYTATHRTFSTAQRTMFVQPGWTLIESEHIPASYQHEDEYFDVYEDSAGNQHHCIIVTDDAWYYTLRGELINEVEVPMEYRSQTDLSFATEQEAFETAKTFAESYGYKISDFYYVDRLPFEELEISSRTIDQSIIEEALPQGWTSDQDAYIFQLFVDIDGLPMYSVGSNPLSEDYPIQTGTRIKIIVTAMGVEYAYFSFQYENTTVQSTGEMCNIEEAINLVSKTIFLNNTRLTPPIKVDYIYLGYLGQWEPSNGAVLLRPFWVFRIQETGPDTLGGQMNYYVDALSKIVTNDHSFPGPEEW
jgi:hypothetical protein